MFKDALKGRTVLVVEDQVVIALDLQQMLRSHGAEIELALDFRKGMELANESFDAAILDGKLANETSLPIANRLKELGVGIVFHSAFIDQTDAKTLHPSAVFLDKPATDLMILSSLMSVLCR